MIMPFQTSLQNLQPHIFPYKWLLLPLLCLSETQKMQDFLFLHFPSFPHLVSVGAHPRRPWFRDDLHSLNSESVSGQKSAVFAVFDSFFLTKWWY